MKRPSEINQCLKDFYEERVSDLISESKKIEQV